MNELNLNVLIAIVAKAMKENFTITTNYDGITVTNNEGKYISLSLYIKTKDEYIDKNSIEINTDRGRNSIENISEEEILRFQLLIKDCERYEKTKLVEDLNNFFKEAEKEVPQEKTINDLDSEDE